MVKPFAVCEIPAGSYPMGDNSMTISRPAHTVQLPAFVIAETVVTNAQFAGFIEAKGYADESLWTASGWQWQAHKREERPAFWDDPQFNAPDQPVVGVCWYEAVAFARWLARESGEKWRLPSEAEWEAAARGAEDEAPRPRLYNTVEMRMGQPWPVTTESNISWCGARDLCGNVWEWCNTRWGRNWQTLDYPYPYHAGDGREDLEGSHARVMRGGSWFDPLPEANPANRARYLPGSRGSNIGFRLARSV
jgi:formylglycine-generating enzyme required for sulfatase activity